MSSLQVVPGNLIFSAYVLVFAVAALVCFGSLTRVRHITTPDIRRGLAALLLTSGTWAAAHVGFLVVPTPPLKLAFYHLGLIFGISTVGPWLYFCSAYTGRTLHQSPFLRRLAIGLFLAIVVVKLTNPVHQLYFRTEFVTTPFPHLAVHNLLLHWLVTGLAYVLASIGYFMLFELFWQVGHDTKPFVVLVGLTGLPIVLDIIGLVSPQLLNFTYEPLGVAAFAVGVLYVYLDDFQTIQLAGEHDDPVIVLDDANQIRDYNTEAQELFPELDTGATIDAVMPEITESLDADEAVVEIDRDGTQYFQISSHPFSTDQTHLGQAITLTDITERAQYRTELERQNERLEQFASIVSHDLRNPLSLAQNQLQLAQTECDSEALGAIDQAHERMEALIEDLLQLARTGDTVTEVESVSLDEHVVVCWQTVATGDATIESETDAVIHADPSQLSQLFENLFRNAIEHGGSDVTIRVGSLEDGSGFYVEDDGPGIPEDERAHVFEYGHSTTEDGTGFGLAIVKQIVEAHGWKIRLTDGEIGGARFEITGVELAQ